MQPAVSHGFLRIRKMTLYTKVVKVSFFVLYLEKDLNIYRKRNASCRAQRNCSCEHTSSAVCFACGEASGYIPSEVAFGYRESLAREGFASAKDL